MHSRRWPLPTSTHQASLLNLRLPPATTLPGRSQARRRFLWRDENAGKLSTCRVELDSASEGYHLRKGSALARIVTRTCGSLLQTFVGANDKAFDHIFLIPASGNTYRAHGKVMVGIGQNSQHVGSSRLTVYNINRDLVVNHLY